MSLPAAKHKTLHVEPDDGQTKSWASIGTFDTIAQPMRYEKSLRILQWHQKSPAIFARRRKSIPASSSTSTFYVPSYTKKFDMILAQSTSTTSHKPNKHLVETLHHGIAFVSCWQWQPDTWSGACRDIQGSSQQQGLGIECWAIVRQFVYYRIV